MAVAAVVVAGGRGFESGAAVVGGVMGSATEFGGEELKEFVLAEFAEEIVDHIGGLVAADEVTDEFQAFSLDGEIIGVGCQVEAA